MNKTLALIIGIFISTSVFSQNDTIQLPEPEMTGGMPLMEALKNRETQRNFDSSKELSEQQLADLLWAANGVNRPESGKRTAPSAVNWQEIEIFVSTKDGVFKYLPNENALLTIHNKDVRIDMGKQEFTGDAPVNLIFVSDHSKMSGGSNSKEFYSATDCGFVSQNVYLYCASEGLATVVLGYIDRDVIAKHLELNEHENIVLTQTIGYPVSEFEEE